MREQHVRLTDDPTLIELIIASCNSHRIIIAWSNAHERAG
jgi:hypothetical protein